MHSLSNSLFGNQDSYWRGAMSSPYSSLQPLSSMASNLPASYSPYDQYSSHHAVTGRENIIWKSLFSIQDRQFIFFLNPKLQEFT